MQLTPPRVDLDPAFPGMLADTAFKRAVSRPVGSDTPIAPGRFVSEDVNGLVQLFGTADCIYSGVAMHDHTLVGSLVPGTTTGSVRGSPLWYKKETMSVLQKAPIWVEVAPGSTLTRNKPVSGVTTAGATTGMATQAGAAGSTPIPRAITTTPVYTLTDGRRVVCVELDAGNAA
jgi:hypothetical protein